MLVDSFIKQIIIEFSVLDTILVNKKKDFCIVLLVILVRTEENKQ